MLILGKTADDKGVQLEILVKTILEGQRFVNVRTNVVGAGGNEVDVTAEAQIHIVGGVQTTTILCEAKAYAEALNMPAWQRFLGKLFIERASRAATMGVMVALGGLNGNVAGSFASLKERDHSLLVFEGVDLVGMARNSGDLAQAEEVAAAIYREWRLSPTAVDIAYYRGAYYHVAWWDEDRYSVLDGRGAHLPIVELERLRDALSASLRGSLVATAEAQVQAERRHDARLTIFNRLMRRGSVTLDQLRDDVDLKGFEDEPFCVVDDGTAFLAPAASLSVEGVTRMFNFLVEHSFNPSQLSYMLAEDFGYYVSRLLEALPDVQAGFDVSDSERETLAALAPLFPSVWLRLANPNPMITTHRVQDGSVTDEGVFEADRVAFWQALEQAIHADYANPALRGFLYDHLGVAELEEATALQVKGKSGLIGHAVETVSRRAVRQFVADETEDVGPVYVMVQMLPGLHEPWESEHPAPRFPLSIAQLADDQ